MTPRWDTAEFPKAPTKDALSLLVSGDGSAPLEIYQDARIYAGTIEKDTQITHNITGIAYLLVSEGQIELNGTTGAKGDGFAISKTNQIDIKAREDAEILVIEVPGLKKAR